MSIGEHRGFANQTTDPSEKESSGNVKIIHGSHDQVFEGLVGHSVLSVQASLKDVFNISEEAKALVNGVKVGLGHQLAANEVLEFVRSTGQKGGDLLTPEEVMIMWKISRSQYEAWLANEGLPYIMLEDESIRHFKLALEEWERDRTKARQGRLTRRPASPTTPHWDEVTKRLYVGDDLIKDFAKCSAGGNQVKVLTLFNNANWPKTLIDPFGDKGTGKFNRTNNETVRGLNQRHKTEGRLRFHSSNGVNIWWEITSPSKVRRRSQNAT